MSTYGDYFSIKTKIIENNVEIFVIFTKQNFYEMIKKNDWKNHTEKIDTFFLGYNDNFKAMKFKIPKSLATIFPDKLKKVLDSQIMLYDISNISYDDFQDMKEKRQKQNYEAFMKALRGEK